MAFKGFFVMDNMKPKTAIFRFYAELNDFLHEDRSKRQLGYNFSGNPSVKDAIEAIGIPHTEVDLILSILNLKILITTLKMVIEYLYTRYLKAWIYPLRLKKGKNPSEI